MTRGDGWFRGLYRKPVHGEQGVRCVGSVLALLLASCASGPPPRGHALYPSALGPKQASEVVQLSGPIVAVDGEKVTTLGSHFEVLPGCHIVEVQPPSSSSDRLGLLSNSEDLQVLRSGDESCRRSQTRAMLSSTIF